MKAIFNKIIVYGLLAFTLNLLSIAAVKADTPLEDIELKLSIETQDLAFDFDDEDEVVQKERVVIYKLEVINQSVSTVNDLRVFMDSPDYMDYQVGTTTLKEGDSSAQVALPDTGEYSQLAIGYFINNIPAGESFVFESKYQVSVPESVIDDPIYTVVWSTLVGPYSAIPVVSNLVNTTISGLPVGSLGVNIVPFPQEGTTVFSGSDITYQYKLTNSGGLPLKNISLVTYAPEGTVCKPDSEGSENCGTLVINEDLAPGELITIDLVVNVTTTDPDKDFVIHTGFGASATDMEYVEVAYEIKHPLNAEIEVGAGEFTLFTEQVPNLVLNSPNGLARADQADISETQYAIQYTGRGKSNTFNPQVAGYGVQESGPDYYDGVCGRMNYAHGINSSVYAYNSSGGGCKAMSSSCISSSQINFEISTTMPSDTPDLVMANNGTHTKTEIYNYGTTQEVNKYMQSGGLIKVPENFTLARAIADGSMGLSNSEVKTIHISEDNWTYEITSYIPKKCNCGEGGCDREDYPIYTWELKPENSTILPELNDDDTTPISVYSSTAWLKTEGGHIGTNGAIINNETTANHVNLQFGGGLGMTPNEYVYDPNTILTPTNQYTKYGATNSDYMIFANQGNEAFISDAGEEWVVNGTDFGFQNHGEVYDRENNPRSYTDDLLVREKFGKVLKNQLPTSLQGTIAIGDDTVWHQTGDLTIGTEGSADEVIFTGGQSRIYVEGDVYINANIFYGGSTGSSYNEITSLRIDARNIYVHGEVTDLEVLLQARDNFYSGESFDQLRILGDVITGNAHWERKPVLEVNPDEVNKPSEYIIEDMRKYVIPVPGDTELPDTYDIWRQVNPSTGQVLDAY